MAIFNSYVSLPEGTDSVFISVIKFSRIFSKVRVPKWLSHSFDFGVGHENKLRQSSKLIQTSTRNPGVN